MSTRLFWENLVDHADTIITAATEADDLPVENVAHRHRRKVYRTGTSQAAETITFDLGSAKAVRAIIILDHDLTGSDSSISLQGNSSDSWGSPAVDETITYNAEKMILVLSADQTYRYWRFIFTKSAAGETRDIGRIFLGPMYECTKGPRQPDGLDIVPEDLSRTDETPDGYAYADISNSRDAIKINFPDTTPDAQMIELRTLARTCGRHTPFFISIRPDEKPYEYLYYCRARSLRGAPLKKSIGSVMTWAASLDLIEEL